MKRRRALPLLLLLLLLLLVGGGGVAWFVTQSPAEPERESADVSTDDGSKSSAADDDATGTREARKRVRTPDAGTVNGPKSGEDDLEAGRAPDDEDAEDNPFLEAPVGSPFAPPGRVLEGRIVDIGTGEPLRRVRVLFHAIRDGRAVMGYGDHSDDDGRFDYRVPEDWGGEGTRYELRVGLRGYRTVVRPVDDFEEEIEIELQPLDRPPQPGRVIVTATHPDGRPITGRVLVSGDDELEGLWQWGHADEAGRVIIEGVLPGHWRLWLWKGEAKVETVVPDGGDVHVHLVGGKTEWRVAMGAETFERRHREVRIPLRGDGVTDQFTADLGSEEAVLRRALEIQDLETHWQAVGPTREVVVTGIPDDGDAWLRAQTRSGPQTFWRVRVESGRARFRTLTLEGWSLVLERPGVPDLDQAIEVTAGEGVQSVAWAGGDDEES